MNGIDSNFAMIALKDLESNNLYSVSLTIDLTSSYITAGDFATNIIASYAKDPEMITVSTPL